MVDKWIGLWYKYRVMEFASTDRTSGPLAPDSGNSPCKGNCARAIRVGGSIKRHIVAGYNQVVDALAHNQRAVRSTRTPAPIFNQGTGEIPNPTSL